MKSQAASDVMGPGAPDSKPVTAAQKVMSARHKAHRREVDKMPDKTPQQKIARLKQGIKYDVMHTKEHNHSAAHNRKVLRKMGVKRI